MTRKLCPKALKLKAKYEQSSSLDLRGPFQRSDRQAYARAMEKHTRKCGLCT